MSIKIEVANKDALKRSDVFNVDPADVTPSPDRDRQPKDDHEQTVRQRAYEIATQGQLQPGIARRDKDNKLVLIAGHIRQEAISLWKNGFTGPDGRTYHNPEATFAVQVTDCSSEEAFLKTLTENIGREDTTDYENAINQERLKQDFKKTDEEIARLYGYITNSGAVNTNKVVHYRKFRQLPQEVQLAVHNGKATFYGVLPLLDVAPEKRLEEFNKARTEDGKVQGAVIAEAVQQQTAAEHEATELLAASEQPANEKTGGTDNGAEATKGDGGSGEATKAPRAAVKPKSPKAIREFFQSYVDEFEDGEAVREFAELFLLWADGKRTDKTFASKIEPLFKGKTKAAKAPKHAENEAAPAAE